MLGQRILPCTGRHTRYIHIQVRPIHRLIFDAKVQLEVSDAEASDSEAQDFETKACFHP